MKRKTVLILIGIFFVSCLFAQTTKFEYDYDAAGNRTTREMKTVFLKKSLEENDTVKEEMGTFSMSVFPNPVQNYLELNITDNTNSKQSVMSETEFQNFYQVYDNNGRILKTNNIYSDTEQIYFGDYPAGIYFLRITYRDKTKDFKIIKQY